MAATAFKIENASKAFLVLQDIEDADTYDFEKDCLIEELTDKLEAIDYGEDSGHVKDRNYPAKIVASKTVEKDYAGVTFGFSLQVVIRSGYYEGCNLDFNLLNVEGYEDTYTYICGEQAIREDLNLLTDLNKGMVNIQARNIAKWIRAALKHEIEQLEQVFAEVSEPYRVVGRFSNGETLYEKV